MRILTPPAAQRIAFLGEPGFEPHVPHTADWALTRFLPVTEGNWLAAAEEAHQWGADVSLVFRPQDIGPEAVARLPGLKIGLIPAPLFGAEAFGRVAAVSRPGGNGFHWLTYLEWPAPRELSGLPLLQTQPLPVDTARFAAGPRLARRALLVPEWAQPPRHVLERIREFAPVEVLPMHATPEQMAARLDEAGSLLYSSRDLLGRFDSLPLLALARGLLLIADNPFPSDWYIEPEDDFLLRAGDHQVAAVDEWQRMPEGYKAVRIRAWQKMREAFDASTAFKRMVHDASLLGTPEAHLAAVREASDATPEIPTNVSRLHVRRTAISS
jgi:hypothetical protein